VAYRFRRVGSIAARRSGELTSLPRHAFKRSKVTYPARSQQMSQKTHIARFGIGQVVRHRIFPFRGVIFDIDPVFNNTEEWWLAIPEEIRPRKDQPYYHLLAENADSEYIAYVSEQNLLADDSGEPLRHPQIKEYFEAREGDGYVARDRDLN
jgi:heat shock protein HspQ